MKAFVLLIALLLQGCSTYTSTYANQSKSLPGGLVYFLPKKDFVIEVDVEKDGKVKGIEINTTPSYPDTSYAFVLSHQNGPLSKNETEISVTNGLITTGKSTFTSGVAQAGKSLADSAAVLGLGATDKPSVPCSKGKHAIMMLAKATAQFPFCNTLIDIEAIGLDLRSQISDVSLTNSENSGIYYRVLLPYRITVTSVSKPTVDKSSIVFSPSQSPNFFVAIPKGFFADNSSDLTFDNGALTKYKVTTNGEVTSALKFPADVIGEYFSAVGKVFSAFSTNDTAETTALTDQLKLEMEKKKFDACVQALQHHDEDLIKSLNCGS